ncbi:hypothetical protein [Streptomyces sp. NPDC057636]|uniref:hypothetical protein n=1 Tax=Streptomyces sp. NPDC057636 TaxID=3346189 RepID=UPI0036921142
MTAVVPGHRQGIHAVLADVELSGAGAAITLRSPLCWNGDPHRPVRAPSWGRTPKTFSPTYSDSPLPRVGGFHDRRVI